jgi:hypothetical protein
MLARTLLWAVLGLATATQAYADVYRYVDKNGEVQYTDRPQTLPAERLDIETRRTDVVALNERLDARHEQAEKEAARETAARDQAAEAREAKEVSAKDRAERCSKARERYEKYATSHRLYEDLGNDERRYLSDSEIDSARDGARKAMDELCGK